MPSERAQHRIGRLLYDFVGALSQGNLDAVNTCSQRHGAHPYLSQAVEQPALLKA